MIFHKIGKEKHKYKVYIKFIKLNNQSTQKGLKFKIKIIRGSHSIQCISLAGRKGYAKFSQQIYVIPLTLFYDEDEKQGSKKKYLQKSGQTEIKVYEYNQQNSDTYKIGTYDFNLAEYASIDSNFNDKIEIKLDPVHKSQKYGPTLIIQIRMQRQDDDSKSVDTYSSNNDQQTVKTTGHDDKIKRKHPSQEKRALTPSKFNHQQQSEIPVNKLPKNSPQLQKQEQSDFFKNQQKKFKKQQKIEEVEEVIKNIEEIKQGQSPMLQVFILQKSLRQKQAEIQRIKHKNSAQQRTITKLIQQSSSKVSYKNNNSQQLQQMKKSITSKQIYIDQLQNKVNDLSSRQQKYEGTILKTQKQNGQLKNKLVNLKYRLAFMMQDFFQNGQQEGVMKMGKYLSAQ